MSEALVYHGPWINFSKGTILGATLTISARDGAILVAFLALFVRFVGGHFWSILCFVLHQLRSSKEPADGLYHQQQTILRNSTSQSSTLWQLMKLPWYWRNHTNHGLLRTLPLICLGALQISVFGVAGLFSSRVTTASDEVLVALNEYCGYITPPTFTEWDSEYLDATRTQLLERRSGFSQSFQYNQNCYSAMPSKIGCNIYAKSNISSQVNNETACPFNDAICIGTDSAFTIDTGYLDSDLDFGINARKEDRIQYRKVMTCSPLHTTDYMSNWTSGPEDSLPEDQYLYYYYGPTSDSDWTYSYDNYSLYDASEAYVMYTQNARYGAPISSNDFDPIQELNTTDADLSLIFLTNNAHYEGPVDDAWFEATNPFQSISYNSTLYSPDYRGVSVLGCYEQYQFCNPTNNICTPLASQNTVGNYPFSNLSLNKRQSATQTMIWLLNGGNTLVELLLSLGLTALNADDYVFGGYGLLSAALPSNQWNIEVVDWHNGIIANLQQLVVSFASGPLYEANRAYITKPNSTEAQDLCDYIKIRSASYSSFSVLGVTIILVVGCFIVLVNMLLAPLTNFIRGKLRPNNYARKEWIHGELLQLLRMTFEGNKLGTWEGRESSVPVAAYGDTFVLPLQGDGQVGSYSSVMNPGKYDSYDGSPMVQDGQFSPAMKQGMQMNVQQVS